MILGTHNSLSYAKPLKWWMKLINFTSKCQDLTIEEQWDFGVRYFDFRISVDYPELSQHGLVVYDVKIYDKLEWLNEKAKETGEKCYVALNLESKGGTAFSTYLFPDIVNKAKRDYKSLIICGGYCKNPWRKILSIENPKIAELHWEFMNFNQSRYTNWERFKHLIQNTMHFSPKYWAKKHNAIYKNDSINLPDDYVLMLDFVEK